MQVSLKKSICMACFRSRNRIWREANDLLWNLGTIACHSKLRYNKSIPEQCPFSAEHVVSEESNDAEKADAFTHEHH